MIGLDLLLESAMAENKEVDEIQGFGESYSPDEEGMAEIREACLEESYNLEGAIIAISNKSAKLISENKCEEACKLQESVVKNFFGKLKTLILNMWKRVKDFFNSAKTYFQSLVMKGNKFAEKYKTEIQGIDSVTIEGYDYKPEAVSLKAIWSKLAGETSKQVSSIESLISKKTFQAKMDKEDAIKGNEEGTRMIKTAVKSGKGSLKTDKQEVAMKMGVTAKPVNVTYKGSEIYSMLSNLNADLNAVAKENQEVDGFYKDAIKQVDSINSKLGEIDSEGSKALMGTINAYSSALKQMLGFINDVAGMKVGVFKKRAEQLKKAAYKGIAENRKNTKQETDKKDPKKVNESTDIASFIEGLIG